MAILEHLVKNFLIDCLYVYYHDNRVGVAHTSEAA